MQCKYLVFNDKNRRCLNMCECMLGQRRDCIENFEINRFKHRGALFDSTYIICGLNENIKIEDSIRFLELVEANNEDKLNENPIVYFSKNVKYVGNIVNSKLNGYGTIYVNDSKYYEGDFKDNLFHGKGKVYSLYCDQYEGGFFNGCAEGYGKIKWCNGNSYEGYFRENLIDGLGIFNYRCGSIYDGVFHMGFRCGKGKFTIKYGNDTNFEIFSDSWIMDSIYGKACLLCNKTSICYKGDICCYKAIEYPDRIYFVPQGTGVLFDERGKEFFVGKFKFGLRNGSGNEYHQNGMKKYSGDFKNDLYEGKGELYNLSGDVIYTGDFYANARHGEGWIYDNDKIELSTFKFDRKFGKCIYTDPDLKTSIDYYNGEKIVSKKVCDCDEEEQKILLEDKCPICCENYNSKDLITKLDNCGHTFHSECLFTWLKNHESCPCCRSKELFDESESKKRRLNEI